MGNRIRTILYSVMSLSILAWSCFNSGSVNPSQVQPDSPSTPAPANSGNRQSGAVASPTKGPGAAFRRPSNGYRFFLMLLDVRTRTVQLALIHPANVPSSVSSVLPGLPDQIGRAAIDAVLALRLPASASTAVRQ